MKKTGTMLAAAMLLAAPLAAQEAPNTVFMEELTWTEVREKIDAGMTTAIIATAGHEQNGPHMVLGKHNYIVTAAAEQIAWELGDALVAPTVTYVPEGSVENPRGHMAKAGTITLPQELFEGLLEYAARSLSVHGFTDIVMIGDSGGNQRGMENVANMLNAEWGGQGARVHWIGDYYGNNGVQEWLEAQGHTPEEIGSHAGIVDTSQLWYVAPQHVRPDRFAPNGGMEDSGVRGDPTKASVAYGKKGVELKIEAALRQIRSSMGSR